MIKLYYIFFKIGLTAFGGGYATLPLIENYLVKDSSYLSFETFKDMIILSQMTPGPIAINAATFIGNYTYNIFYAIFSTLGVISPQIIILLLCIKFLNINNKYIKKAIYGINIAIIFFIAVLFRKLFKITFSIDKIYIFILYSLMTLVLSYKKVSIAKIIILNIIITTFLIFIGAL